MFDWRRYFELAGSFASSNDEALLRTAISRSYYSAYHVATSVVRSQAILVPNRHRIWDQLEYLGIANGRPELLEIARLGRALKRRREQADYHSPFNRDDQRQAPIQDVVSFVLDATHQLLDLLDAL